MDKTMSAMTMEPDRPPQGAARVGMELRLVRERLGWRLGDVAAELRIRLPYLEAIERGELSALPGAAYQTGFVRTYAQALGLDGDEILRRFRAEGTGFVPKAELSFLAPVPDRAVPTGALVLVGVVLVLVGYGLWYRHTSQEAQLAAQIPSVPTELAPLAVPPKPPEAAPAKLAEKTPAATMAATAHAPAGAAPATALAGATPAGTAPAATAAPASTAPASTAPATTVPAAAPATAPGGDTPSGAAPAGAAPTGAAPAVQTASLPAPPPAAPAPAAPAAATTPSATPAQPSAQKIIEATGNSWIQVQDAKGNILFSKTLHAGDSWPVPDLPGLTMTAGNAGATVIDDNGRPGAPLGAAGTVIRKYALTAGAVVPASVTAPAAAPGTPSPGPAASNAPLVSGPEEGPSPTGPVSTN
jgi:cytoskeleton protein RodZ